VLPPHCSAVTSEPRQCPFKAAAAHSDPHRHRLERLTGAKDEPPVVLDFGGPEHGQVGASWEIPSVTGHARDGVTPRVLAHLPVPTAIVLHLPNPGMPTATVHRGAHR
jgi:hypothetical protein